MPMLDLPTIAPRYAAWLLVRALGGQGSGNFGHEGRPGEVGGSGAGAGIQESSADVKDSERTDLNSAMFNASDGGDRRKMKATIVSQLNTRLDIEDAELKVQKRLDLWASTSGDHSPAAIEMQLAVKREFNLKDVAHSHMGETFEPSLKNSSDNSAYIRAEYANTQAWFKAQGMTHISVVRGQGGLRELKDGNVEVRMQPASSWSTDFEMATSFGKTTLATRVPVSRVLSTAVTGRGCLSEREVILLGGRINVHVISMGQDAFGNSESSGDYHRRVREYWMPAK